MLSVKGTKWRRSGWLWTAGVTSALGLALTGQAALAGYVNQGARCDTQTTSCNGTCYVLTTGTGQCALVQYSQGSKTYKTCVQDDTSGTPCTQTGSQLVDATCGTGNFWNCNYAGPNGCSFSSCNGCDASTPDGKTTGATRIPTC